MLKTVDNVLHIFPHQRWKGKLVDATNAVFTHKPGTSSSKKTPYSQVKNDFYRRTIPFVRKLLCWLTDEVYMAGQAQCIVIGEKKGT